ncbi:MAG: OsmC family protein [Planctomycetota bacterium]
MAHQPFTATVRIGNDPYTSTIKTEGHDLVSDEPTNLGGQNAGPSPYGHLLAAIGACKTITMRMYADRKGWALESATVELTHSRERPGVERIDAVITLEGDLSDEQRTRIREIADRCPVHRTITGDLTVASTLAERV